MLVRKMIEFRGSVIRIAPNVTPTVSALFWDLNFLYELM
jgi:hypothetical protein